MITTLDILDLSRKSAWERAVDAAGGSIFHSWHYLSAISKAYRVPVSLYVDITPDHSCIAPFSQRQFKGTVDIYSPYGFNGISIRGRVTTALERWRTFAKAQGFICGYFTQSLPAPAWVGNEKDAVGHHSAYLLDIRLSLPELKSKLSKSIKSKLADLSHRSIELTEPSAVNPTALKTLYLNAMKGAGASSSYMLLAHALADISGNENALVLTAAKDQGELSSAALFLVDHDIAHYFVSASTPGDRDMSASLIWRAVEILKERGVSTLSLGGGVKPGDGLAQFKRRFGGDQIPVYSLRQVYDADRYTVLCEEFSQISEQGKFFPSYRG